MSLLTVHQVIKFLYIFRWTNIVGLNEAFFATFITFATVILSILTTFVFTIKQEVGIEYYLCIGQYPWTNLTDNMTTTRQPTDDPIHTLSFLMFGIVILLSVSIHIYSHKYWILKQLKRCCQHFDLPWMQKVFKTVTIADENDLTSSFRDIFVSSGLYVAVAVTTLGLLIWCISVIESADYSYFNTDNGRLHLYIIKCMLTAMPSVFLPAFVIFNNTKMRNAIATKYIQVFKADPIKNIFN